jgi:U3 small nucleolar RNA-associated protein 19
MTGLAPPTKKRKTQNHPDFNGLVRVLEKQLTEAATANSPLNALADLLDLLYSAQDPQDTSKAIYALYRVLVTVIMSGKLGLNGGDENTKVVQAWIRDKLDGYVDFLAGLLKDEERFLRVGPNVSPVPLRPDCILAGVCSPDIIFSTEAPLSCLQQNHYVSATVSYLSF